MATELAKAYVQIIPSARGMGDKIGEEMGKESSSAGTSAGNSFSSFFKKAIAAAGVGIAVKKVFSDAFSEGAALQQSLGGVETLFKGSADKVKAYANEAYKTAGLSANEYMTTATSFSASLLQSLGGDTNAAADIANMALIDMSDNANKFGTDMGRIQDAYKGFAKQNYTMLDNLSLGYGGTKTEMERLLADATKLTGVKYDINNLSDVYNAIHAVQENLDITGTTAKESASTWSGSLASVKAAYKNLMANLMLGNDLGPSLQALSTTVVTFLTGSFIPAVINILKGLPEAVATIITTLAPKLLGLGVSLVKNLGAGITQTLPDTLQKGNDTLQTFIDGILTKIPDLIQGAITCIGQFLVTVTSQLPSIITMGGNLLLKFVNGILNRIPSLIQSASTSITNFLNTVYSKMPSVLQTGGDVLSRLITGILQRIPSMIQSAITAVNNFISTISQRLPAIWQAGSEVLLKLVRGIIDNFPQIVSSAVQAIIRFVATIGQNLPQILQAGISILGGLAAGLVRAIPSLIGHIPGIIRQIIDTFGSVDWWSIGINIISGIANGLANAGHQLWSAVKDILGSFKDNVLHFFGINSPSRWGAYVGEMIDLGFAGGIEDNVSPITSAVKSLEDEATKPFSGDFAYSLSSGTVSASGNETDSVLLNRFDALIGLMEQSVSNGQETTIVLNNRKVGRALREVGVAFN